MKPFDITTWNPSDYLEAMIIGLRKLSDHPDFAFRMTTFGEVEVVDGRRVCFGCAATAAIGEIAGKLYPDVIASIEPDDLEYFRLGEDNGWAELAALGGTKTGLDGVDWGQSKIHWVVGRLEVAFDDARQGSLGGLFNFCQECYPEGTIRKMSFNDRVRWNGRWHLSSMDWADEIHLIESTIVEMRAVGL